MTSRYEQALADAERETTENLEAAARILDHGTLYPSPDEMTAYFANQAKDELLKLGEFKPKPGASLQEMTFRIAAAVLSFGDMMGRDWTGWRVVVVPGGRSFDDGGYIDMETLRQKVKERLQR